MRHLLNMKRLEIGGDKEDQVYRSHKMDWSTIANRQQG
jgi:hypothetical protein